MTSRKPILDGTGLTTREYFAAHAPPMPACFEPDIPLADALGMAHRGTTTMSHRGTKTITLMYMAKWPWHYADMVLAAQDNTP